MKKPINIKKDKILLLSWENYPLYAGGLGVMVKSVVEELIKQGKEPVVALPHKLVSPIPNTISLEKLVKKYNTKKQDIPGFNFNLDYFRTTNNPEGRNVWPSLFSDSKSKSSIKAQNLYTNNTPLLTRAYAFAVAEFLETNNDFVAIIGFDWMSIASFYLLKEKQITTPFLFYIHSTEHDRNLTSTTLSKTAKALWALEKEYFKQANQLIAISGITKNILVEHFEVPEQKIETVYDDIEFKPAKSGIEHLSKNKNVLFIGRFATQKGLYFLLDTASKVVETDSHVKFFLAGDGESLPLVVEKIANLGLERNVILTGWIDTQTKKKLYKSCSLFVMPSPSEPFGLTALEAIRSDLPVIASENCGFIDVVPSTKTFKYYDTNEFAHLILYYLNNDKERNELILTQQKELSVHNWSVEVSKIIKLIDKNYE